ncbi:MAG: butyrate kinase [bacterium]
MKSSYRILSINPGSTTTKVAVYDDEKLVMQETLNHTAEDLAPYKTLADQFSFRKDTILGFLRANGIDLESIDAVSARGGDLGPIPSGTFRVNPAMVEASRAGSHASNLGPIIAADLAETLNIPAFTVDPCCVDEFEDIARISGWPELPRRSVFHPLNQKAIARKAAKDLGKKYEDVNFIVAHMGGGISVGAHRKGRIIDVNIGETAEFTPERGYPPAYSLISLCFSGKYAQEEINKKMMGRGGIYAYLGTKDAREVEKMIAEGNAEAKLVYEAMAYQVAKNIGALAAILGGEVDAILLTGGIAYSEMFTEWVRERVEYIAPVKIYPGEKELESLALGALRVLRGEEEAKTYPPAQTAER